MSSARKRFADCALIEIIHLHDCLRGSLMEIQKDVQTLMDSSFFIVKSSSATDDNDNDNHNHNHNHNEKNHTENDTDGPAVSFSTKNATPKFEIYTAANLSNSVASRFHLIFSVFQAHSGAEDEFIWPALKMKIESKKQISNNQKQSKTPCGCQSTIEQEEYEEDHATEESMFKQIQTTLRRLNGSFRYYHAHVGTNDDHDDHDTNNSKNTNTNTNSNNDDDYKNKKKNESITSTSTTSTSTSISISNNNKAIKTDEQSCLTIIRNVICQLKDQTDTLTQHLLQHLAKEETQCLPMVQRHLSNDEISTLVGNIMGQRSAEIMSKILNLAVCSLPEDERDDMVNHMKKAMTGTFFEKWLNTGGWLKANTGTGTTSSNNTITNSTNGTTGSHPQQQLQQQQQPTILSSPFSLNDPSQSSLKRTRSSSPSTDHDNNRDTTAIHHKPPKIARHHKDARLRHPSRYYVKSDNGQIDLVWNR